MDTLRAADTTDEVVERTYATIIQPALAQLSKLKVSGLAMCREAKKVRTVWVGQNSWPQAAGLIPTTKAANHDPNAQIQI